ncbi:hypothetical protein MRX96_050927 [Rhipicephalus microplus]
MRKEDQNQPAVDQDRRSRKRSKSRNRNSSISAQKSCSPSQETSASMPAIHNNKNAWSNGPPKSVGWSTDNPGQTSKAETTQLASNTKQGGQDQEPVNIPNSRRPFHIQFEIKDTATGKTSRRSGERTDRAGKLFTATVGFGQ